MNNSTVKQTEQVRVENVRFIANVLRVELDDGREISLPMKEVPWLKWLGKATPKQRTNWSLEPKGFAIYWPVLDDGFGFCHFLDLPPFREDCQGCVVAGRHGRRIGLRS